MVALAETLVPCLVGFVIATLLAGKALRVQLGWGSGIASFVAGWAIAAGIASAYGGLLVKRISGD